MCPFRGKVSFRVYMPQKPNKYGMKLFILAESRTGYIWNFEVYHGKYPEVDNSAAGVVKRLLDKLTNKGHTVYVDRFYTIVPLAEELAKANTGLVGTIMTSRKGLPKALEAKIKKGVLPKDDCSFPAVERQEGCVDAEQQTQCPDHKDFQ
jgi:hypothetical protein